MRSSGWQMKAVTICRICTKETCSKLENSRKIFPYCVTLALFSFIHSFNHWANIGGSMSDRDKSLWVTCASLKTLQSCLSHSPSPPFPSKRLRHTRWSGTTQEPAAAAAAKSLQSSDSWRPHGLQPTRLLHPWDFPGKSTGVGCHRLLRRRSLREGKYFQRQERSTAAGKRKKFGKYKGNSNCSSLNQPTC